MPDWKNLPTLFTRDALHPAVVEQADRRAVEKPDEVWCVAFSGGADSLALLLTVLGNWPEKRSKLAVLHFNHRQRAADSDGDAAFCRETCGRLGVPFHAGEWAGAKIGASEAEAREARQAFFAKEMAKAGSLILWTGHQKEDVAETMLMRIARGSGTAGLAAPRPVQSKNERTVFLRPLLTLTKAQIVEALTRAGVAWREDASNAGGSFFRNRVRLHVVPNWRAAAENDALDGAALTRELLEQDDEALSRWLEDLMPGSSYPGDVLDVRMLAGKPRALWRRALRRWAPLASLPRIGFEEALTLCEHGAGRWSAGEGVVDNRGGILRYHAAESCAASGPWREVGLREGEILFLPGGGSLRVDRISFDGALRRRIRSGAVNPVHEAFVSSSQTAFRVRTWEAGDRYRPLGSPGSAKVQDLFVNRKIPAECRALLPLVIGDRGIVWIPGFPPAEESKMTDDSVTGVRLTYETGTCTVRP